MPRNHSEVVEDIKGPCTPSGWWVKCHNCDRMFVSVIYHLDLMCSQCFGTCTSIENGAVWGYEWHNLVLIRALRNELGSKIEQLTKLKHGQPNDS